MTTKPTNQYLARAFLCSVFVPALAGSSWALLPSILAAPVSVLLSWLGFLLIWDSVCKFCSNSKNPRAGAIGMCHRSGNPFDYQLDFVSETGSSPLRDWSSPEWESYLAVPTYTRWNREQSAEFILEIIPPEARGADCKWDPKEDEKMKAAGFRKEGGRGNE